jgi:hypothetical protein
MPRKSLTRRLIDIIADSFILLLKKSPNRQ